MLATPSPTLGSGPPRPSHIRHVDSHLCVSLPVFVPLLKTSLPTHFMQPQFLSLSCVGFGAGSSFVMCVVGCVTASLASPNGDRSTSKVVTTRFQTLSWGQTRSGLQTSDPGNACRTYLNIFSPRIFSLTPVSMGLMEVPVLGAT